jgi:N-dimethylarginine dimethylaminohydrolase
VRPQFFAVVKPVNVTQERFYGTAEQPSREIVVAQHDAIRQGLVAEGVRVVDVPPDPRFPLQFNVRDAAAVVGTRVVLGRMARSIRVGEPEVVEAQLPDGTRAPEAGFLEGGDIIVTPSEIVVGLSMRTDNVGVRALQELVGPSRRVRPIELARDVLHLDVAMGLVGPRTGLIHRASIAGELPSSLSAVDWIDVTDEEAAEQGTNVLSLGPRRIAHDRRHSRIAAELRSRGFECVPFDLDELTKVGGGLRCMTLPLRRAGQEMSHTVQESQ